MVQDGQTTAVHVHMPSPTGENRSNIQLARLRRDWKASQYFHQSQEATRQPSTCRHSGNMGARVACTSQAPIAQVYRQRTRYGHNNQDSHAPQIHQCRSSPGQALLKMPGLRLLGRPFVHSKNLPNGNGLPLCPQRESSQVWHYFEGFHTHRAVHLHPRTTVRCPRIAEHRQHSNRRCVRKLRQASSPEQGANPKTQTRPSEGLEWLMEPAHSGVHVAVERKLAIEKWPSRASM